MDCVRDMQTIEIPSSVMDEVDDIIRRKNYIYPDQKYTRECIIIMAIQAMHESYLPKRVQ